MKQPRLSKEESTRAGGCSLLSGLLPGPGHVLKEALKVRRKTESGKMQQVFTQDGAVPKYADFGLKSGSQPC